MRMLTKRAMSLAKDMKERGAEVFETFPGATSDLLGLDRKDRSLILNFYMKLPLELEGREYSQDELDAVACWLAGICHLMGKSLVFSGKDGQIVVASRECVECLGD